MNVETLQIQTAVSFVRLNPRGLHDDLSQLEKTGSERPMLYPHLLLRSAASNLLCRFGSETLSVKLIEKAVETPIALTDDQITHIISSLNSETDKLPDIREVLTGRTTEERAFSIFIALAADELVQQGCTNDQVRTILQKGSAQLAA